MNFDISSDSQNHKSMRFWLCLFCIFQQFEGSKISHLGKIRSSKVYFDFWNGLFRFGSLYVVIRKKFDLELFQIYAARCSLWTFYTPCNFFLYLCWFVSASTFFLLLDYYNASVHICSNKKKKKLTKKGYSIIFSDKTFDVFSQQIGTFGMYQIIFD